MTPYREVSSEELILNSLLVMNIQTWARVASHFLTHLGVALFPPGLTILLTFLFVFLPIFSVTTSLRLKRMKNGVNTEQCEAICICVPSSRIHVNCFPRWINNRLCTGHPFSGRRAPLSTMDVLCALSVSFTRFGY